MILYHAIMHHHSRDNATIINDNALSLSTACFTPFTIIRV
jgi:hypothetical protein